MNFESDHDKDPGNGSNLFSMIYLVCAVVSLLRGLLSLRAGSPMAALIHFVLGVIFLVIFVIYRKRSS